MGRWYKTAHRLVAEWPGSRLVIVEAAGHTLGHKAIFEAVRAGISDLTGELNPAA